MHVDDGIENVYSGQGEDCLSVIHMVLGFLVLRNDSLSNKVPCTSWITLKSPPLVPTRACLCCSYICTYVYLFLVR